MSPEQVIGRDVDGRADIYSLGAVLYEMLTGFPPFAGGDLNTVLSQIIKETPAAPSSRNRSIAPTFDYIVAKAMAKDPDDRYPSARAMAAELRNFGNFGIGRPAGEIAVPLQSASAANSPVAASSTLAAAAESAALRSRRKLIIYGVPAALLTVVAGWAVLSKHAPDSTEAATNQAQDKSSAPTLADANPAAAEVPRKEPERVEQMAPSQPAAPPETTPSVTRKIPAVGKPTARLALAITPWGEVYVDGRRWGISPPLVDIKLVPGKHTVEIRNSTFPPYTKTVELEAGGRLKIKHKFQ